MRSMPCIGTLYLLVLICQIMFDDRVKTWLIVLSHFLKTTSQLSHRSISPDGFSI